MSERPKLGEILVSAGVVDEHQVLAALGQQQKWGGRLGQTLVGMGALNERNLVRALASQLGLPVVHLEGKRIEPEVLDLLPRELAEKHRCLPLFVKKVDGVGTLYLGMEEPSDVAALDDVRFRLAMPVSPILVSQTDLHDAIVRSYPGVDLMAPPESTLDELVLDEMAEDREVDPGGDEPMEIEHDSKLLELEVSLSEELATVSSAELLKALTQLLVENDLLTRREIIGRIRSLRVATPEK